MGFVNAFSFLPVFLVHQTSAKICVHLWIIKKCVDTIDPRPLENREWRMESNMEQLTTSLQTVSPEIIKSFEGLEAVALLGLCFFVLLAVVIPTTMFFMLRNHANAMRLMQEAFNHALDKRDEDQRKITETLDKMIESIDHRLSALEMKVDRLKLPP